MMRRRPNLVAYLVLGVVSTTTAQATQQAAADTPAAAPSPKPSPQASPSPKPPSLTTAPEDSWFRPIVGVGASRYVDDYVDFEVKDDVLFVKNDSKYRTSTFLGGSFRLPWTRWDRVPERDCADRADCAGPWRLRSKPSWALPAELILALEFADGTTRVLDGLTVGLGWPLHPHLSLVGGGTIRRGSELSVGFRREAARFVGRKQIGGTADEQARFARFLLNESRTGLVSDSLYDGLPLKDGETAIFPGAPTNSSFNWSFHVGFVLPINFGIGGVSLGKSSAPKPAAGVGEASTTAQ